MFAIQYLKNFIIKIIILLYKIIFRIYIHKTYSRTFRSPYFLFLGLNRLFLIGNVTKYLFFYVENINNFLYIK